MIAGSPPWMLRAACQGMDPELFFPHQSTKERELEDAYAACEACPVRIECRDYAIADPSLMGIWGGLRFGQRMRQRLAKGLDPKVRTRSLVNRPEVVPKPSLRRLDDGWYP